MKTYTIYPGTPIEIACAMVRAIVERTGEPHRFEFNGVATEVHEGMSLDDIMEKAFQGKVKLERYKKEKFEFDLRTAVWGALGNTMAAGDDRDVETVLSAIRPFLRTP